MSRWTAADLFRLKPSGDLTGATDTAALQAAIDEGGVVLLGRGTFVTDGLLIKSGATLRGEGPDATVVKLADGANTDLVTVPSFAELTGTNSSDGETQFGFDQLTLDGNGDNQTGTSWTFRVYGYGYRMSDVEILHGRTGNVFSEWGKGLNPEAYWTRFKIRQPVANGAINLDWRGPSDSVFTDGIIVSKDNAYPAGQIGIWTRGNAGAEVWSGVHVWGYHEFGWIAERSMNALNCQIEGAYGVNLKLLTGRCRFHGRIFGTTGQHAGEIGIQFGDATHTNIRNCTIDVDTTGWVGGSFFIDWVSTAGTNRIRGAAALGTASALWRGSPHPWDDVDLVTIDGTIDQNQERVGHPVRITAPSGAALWVGSMTYDNLAQILNLISGARLRGYKDNFVTATYQLDAADGSVRAGTPAGLGGRRFSGSGAPTIAGTAGDRYDRIDTPTVAGQREYVCTVTGAAGAAIWVGIV